MTGLRISGLTVEHTRGPYAIRPIQALDAAVDDGELALVLGPSGCGKTTLLSCIAGALTPAEGSIRLGGREVGSLHGASLTEFRRSGIGIVFQSKSLIPSLTARENVLAPLRLAGVERRVAQARGDELLELVGLADRGDQLPGQLSADQCQRVAIARALVHDPPLIVADEPTARLDYVQVEEVLGLLRQLAAPGRMVVVASHDRRFQALADQVIDLTPPAGFEDDGVRVLSLAAGERLFRQGDRSDLIYVVERGHVEVYRERVDGSEELRSTLGPGEYFGELGPLLSLPRAASARATETAVLTSYGTEAFRLWRTARAGRRIPSTSDDGS